MDDTPLIRTQKLRESPQRQCAISWPLAIDLKVERMLARATETGENTSRKEIVAALVFAAELSAEELSEVVRRYRRAAVGDVLGDASQSAEVVTFTRRKPGPRSR
ncbi:hypothetical protein [uncultured Nocardioides sp.]|uniref:hypothetical protein n=1 Tax=uncultured Nocardioides sp. TaxID=198441 RepID=UPI0026327A60|nr:hypothetical protein [uncultured Nocardioides sp.]